MPDTKKYETIQTADGINIRGVPIGTDDQILKPMVASLRSSSGAGVYDFEAIAKTQSRPSTAPTSLSGPSVSQPVKPETTVGGVFGGILRELGPTAAAGIAGLLIGGPVGAGVAIISVGITDLITPYITKFLNDRGMKQLDSKEAASELFTKMGIEKPDTKVEELFASGARGAKEVAQIISGGVIAQFGTPVVGVGNLLQESGKVVAAAPGKQVVGEIGAALGAMGGQEAAEKFFPDNEIMAVVTPLLGSLAGDMTATGIAGIADKVRELMTANKMDLPSAAAEAVRIAKANKVPVLLDDFTPTTAKGVSRRAKRETSTALKELRKQQDPARTSMVQRYIDSNDLPEGSTVRKEVQNAANDYLTKHDADWKAAVTCKNEILDAFPDTYIVDTSKTVDMINEIVEEISAGGDAGMQPILNKLYNWREMIQNKNLNQLEVHRETIGGFWTDKEMAGLKTTSTKKKINDIYISVRKDMGEFIKANGSAWISAKYEDTMSTLSTLSKEFSEAGTAAILKSRKAPMKAVKNAIFNEDPEIVRNIYKKLTPNGQASMRAAVIDQMIDNSTNQGELSPNAWAKQIKKFAGQNGVIISGDVDHLEAMKLVLDQTKRADIVTLAKEQLPFSEITGVTRGISALFMAKPVQTLSAMLGVTAARGWVIKQMESPRMRDLLLKYRAMPEAARASTRGQEALKRMGEVVRGYAIAEDETSKRQGR